LTANFLEKKFDQKPAWRRGRRDKPAHGFRTAIVLHLDPCLFFFAGAGRGYEISGAYDDLGGDW